MAGLITEAFSLSDVAWAILAAVLVLTLLVLGLLVVYVLKSTPKAVQDGQKAEPVERECVAVAEESSAHFP